METKSSSSSFVGAATSDEHLLLQKTLFSATLKDLKGLREQLYTAAEQFEESYRNTDQKQKITETCTDYAIKALVNTVDHLGSVAFKLNSYLDHAASEVAATDLGLSSLDQRLKTWQQYINQGGMYQNSLAFKLPKHHHKQYIIPEEGKTPPSRSSSSFEIDFSHSSPVTQNGQMKNSSSSSPSSFLRGKGLSQFRYQQACLRQATVPFSWSTNSSNSNKRSESPLQYPLLRSGSLLVKRAMSPNNVNGKPQNSLPPRRVVSWSEPRRDGGGEQDEKYHSSKSKRIFKSLVSLRRPRKDDGSVYKHLEEI